MFNLIHDPWLPVETADGTLVDVSIHQALMQAHTLRRLVHPSPVVLPSMHRLLLAILHRALRGPAHADEAADWFERGHFPADSVQDYLDTWQHRFELFHPEHPFYQVPNLEGKTWGITTLAAELASSSNRLLFDHTRADTPPKFSHAELAQLLITEQMTAIPFGRGYGYSPVGGSALVLPQGETLFETLLLNLVPYKYTEADKPIWEQKVPGIEAIEQAEARVPIGIAERYTWLTRAIRFPTHNDAEYITEIAFAPGIKLDRTQPDPMVAYRKDPKRGLIPIKFYPHKAFWRDFQALTPRVENSTYLPPLTLKHAIDVYEALDRQQPLPILVTGSSNDSKRVGMLVIWRSIQFHFPEALQTNHEEAPGQLARLLETADEAHSVLQRATYKLATDLLTMAERSPDKGDVRNLVDAMPSSGYYWSQLETHFPELLQRFSQPYAEQLAWWKGIITHVLRQAWQLAETSAGENGRAWRAASMSGGIVGKHIKALQEAV